MIKVPVHVLIINNNTTERNTIEEYLNIENYDISSCMDWKEGRKIVEESKDVGIIVIPFSMPNFSGFSFIEDIQSLDLDKKPHIVFLADEETITEAVSALTPVSGDYLMKPLSPEGLRARIAITKQSIALKEKLDRVKRDSDSLALYDQLTGVLNRQAVYDQALAEISRAQREVKPLTVAMIELSNLQQIEAKYGNDVRDQALRYLSSAVRANVRIYDILGRWMGAKFLLMLPNTNVDDSSIVIERVKQSIATIGIELPDHSRLRVDVNFGVSSISPEQTVPLYMLVEQANSALMSASKELESSVTVYDG